MLNHLKKNRGLSLFMDLGFVYVVWRFGLYWAFCVLSLKLLEEDTMMPPTPGITVFEIVFCGLQFSIYTRLAEKDA